MQCKSLWIKASDKCINVNVLSLKCRFRGLNKPLKPSIKLEQGLPSNYHKHPIASLSSIEVFYIFSLYFNKEVREKVGKESKRECDWF